MCLVLHGIKSSSGTVAGLVLTLSATGPLSFSASQDSQGHFIDPDKKRRARSNYRMNKEIYIEK